MMRFLSSTTLSSTAFSSRRLASALRNSAHGRSNAGQLDAKTVTCIATAVLLGGALFSGQAFGASDTSFTYSQVEADPLAPVAALATAKDGTSEQSTAGYTPPEYDGIRTIEIDMAPRAFSAKTIEVYKGETVRFVLRNSSPMSNDFTIGTKAMQDFRRRFLNRVAHEDLAAKDRDLLDNWNAVVVLPGETRELVWTFDKTEKIEFGSNLHGHYEAGMKGRFTAIDTQETVTAENAEADPLAADAPAAPVTVASTNVVTAPSTPVKLAPASETAFKTTEADPLTTTEPLVAPAPPAPPVTETAAAETPAPETQSPETQTTIITPAAVTSATETPAKLEPGLDIISPDISAAEFAALINSASKMPATEQSASDTADATAAKAKEVKTAALGGTVTDALESGPDSAAPRTTAFASGTLPDNGLDFPGVRRSALVQTARANIEADPVSDAQSVPLSPKFATPNPKPTSSPAEASLQDLARQQSSLDEAKRHLQAKQVPAPRQRPATWKPVTAAAPIPKPGSRLAALNAEGLNDASFGGAERVTASPIRKKFVVLSIRDHMRMGKMREQALLSRSLERRAYAKLAPAPTQLAPTQQSVPAKRQPIVTRTNFSSTPYGGDSGKYRGEIVDKGDRGVPVEIDAIRRISDNTIRKLDDAGNAILRTAGTLIKKVGLNDTASFEASDAYTGTGSVDENGAGEFGESKK